MYLYYAHNKERCHLKIKQNSIGIFIQFKTNRAAINYIIIKMEEYYLQVHGAYDK